MRENTKNDINQFFAKKLYTEMNELDVTIFQEIQKVKEEANNRGVLHSGMTLNGIADAIINNTFSSCKKKLNLIDEFQDYMKFNIPESYLAEIGEIYSFHYVPFLTNKVEKTYVDHAKGLFGDSFESVTNQLKLNNSIQNLKLVIGNKIDDVKIKNRLKKDEPSVRLAKYSNAISLIAIIIAIVSLFFSK